jgi:hypothetical protein
MSKFRNDITHNYLPGHIRESVRKHSEDDMSFGGGTYTPSKEIVDNVFASAGLFREALEAIRAECANHPRTVTAI